MLVRKVKNFNTTMHKPFKRKLKVEKNKFEYMEQNKSILRKFEPKTEIQAVYYEAIKTNKLTFGVGPAGTGKTYVAVRAAVELLVNREIDKIFITRPIIEAGDEEIGILPGGIEEKLHPYFYPIEDSLNRMVTKVSRIKEKIEISPLAFMRGRTFWNCVVILDEAQNTTPNQMKMFLSRLGEKCIAIVNGDPSQKDISGISGLEVAAEYLQDLPKVFVCDFYEEDIVRSKLVKMILSRWPKNLR